jgi:hypothetical protein
MLSQKVRQYFEQPISKVKSVVAFVVVCLAFLGGWAVVRPDVRVEPYIQLDPSSPFSERFKVSNNGYFEIYDVDSSCGIISANTDKNQVFKNGLVDSGSGYRNVLGAGDSTTVDCPLSKYVRFDAKYVSAEIVFFVKYRPSWYMWHKRKMARFSGELDSEGHVQWVPR